MLESYLNDLSFGEKRSLKEGLQNGFPGGEIDLNNMTFIYDESSGLVTVHDLIVGEGVHGMQLPLAEFVALVHTVTADVPLYANQAEEAEALNHYLQELSIDDRETLRRRLPDIQRGEELILDPLEFLYDVDDDIVRIDVRQPGSRHDMRDGLFLRWGVFVGVVDMA